MQFHSPGFLLFFAAVLLVHHVLPLPWRAKKAALLGFSYLFYAAEHPPFVALLAVSTVVDWFAAKGMHGAVTPGMRRFWLGLSLTSNLGMLGYFKYGGFLIENFVAAVHALGWTGYEPGGTSILLPVGISFFTFQTLSYTIDVYRGNAPPWPSLLDFALYVSFFPQLVAGPIVRATDFLPQLTAPRRADSGRFCWGLSLIVVGLFEKVALADAFLGPAANAAFGAPGAEGAADRLAAGYGFADAWIGTLAFAGQIFCDFAGYSTCAIGVAMCLGFALPENFRFPYAAVGFSDFWRRWHISLSGWLRDYLYIPLGGNRGGRWFTLRNLALTMLLGGLWHGAAWTFLAWGGLHGALLIAERSLRSAPVARWSLWSRWYGELALIAATFLAICVTWTFFRAGSFAQAAAMLEAMSGLNGVAPATAVDWAVAGPALAAVAGLLTVHYLRRHTTLEAAAAGWGWGWISLSLVLMALATAFAPRPDDATFIYFQF
ncbi:MBOAT family O-acyltransferase [Alienimonas californiensis]|uniref:Peptidoglycan O-acetyltransferase n=1 Tax=Alienimonas californiensis TaxID=2527989 RepID=A0A517PE68_9PLAN|nr:MBOAT family O-acyltransferase [Alienimonas californiensis]QDT17658.1 Peptidoglycan O-acetyltransferase [Alienimonas californiensis]